MPPPSSAATGRLPGAATASIGPTSTKISAPRACCGERPLPGPLKQEKLEGTPPCDPNRSDVPPDKIGVGGHLSAHVSVQKQDANSSASSGQAVGYRALVLLPAPPAGHAGERLTAYRRLVDGINKK